MFTDFVLNGRGTGPVGEFLVESRFETGLLRPYLNDKGQRCVTLNTGKTWDAEKKRYVPKYEAVTVAELMTQHGIMNPVLMNSANTLRKDEWIQVDRSVIKAYRDRLRAWTDLVGVGTYSINGMGKSILEQQTQSDPGEAFVDMDGLTAGRGDTPLFKLEGIPLPITHSDFFFDSRTLSISRNGGEPLNVIMAEAAGRRIAEKIERMVIGLDTPFNYGAAAAYGRSPGVYGYMNFPDRATKTNMTAPTGSNGTTILNDFLALRELLYSSNRFGPYMIYVSPAWDQYLDNLFSTTEPSAGTLRSRLKQVEDFTDIRRLDRMTGQGFTVIMVQMSTETAQAIVGMPVTTVQWDTKGGMQKNFKVMTIQVPWLKADYYGNCGIAVGTTS